MGRSYNGVAVRDFRVGKHEVTRRQTRSRSAMLEALEARQFMSASDAIDISKYILPGTSQSPERIAALKETIARMNLSVPVIDPSVDSGFKLLDAESGPLIGLPTMHTSFPSNTGSGYSVVVLDTGADLDHPFFGASTKVPGVADRIVYQYDFAADILDKYGKYEDTDASDTNGHGTNVASIIASQDATLKGMAPGVNLIILKVFNSSDQSPIGSIENALTWVVNNAATYNVVSVNMSFGGSENYNVPTEGYISDELKSLYDMGIVVAAAAGNEYLNYHAQGVAYPAADPSTLAVGAVYDSNFGNDMLGPYIAAKTDADRLTYFSDRSTTMVDIFAPGSAILAAGLAGGTGAISGTSQASPHIAGLVAVAQSIAQSKLGRKLTVAEYRALLQKTGDWIFDGDDEVDVARNTQEGYKRVDALAMAQAITSTFGQGISGEVWDDVDRDGVHDLGEGALSGVKVFIDSTNNDRFDVGEVYTITDAFGGYILPNMAAGTYSVEMELPDGFERITVAPTWSAPAYQGVKKYTAGTLPALNGATDVAISGDGKYLYVTSATDNTLSVFSRDLLTNALTYVEKFTDSATTDGLAGAYGVAVSPDGLNVYVAGETDDAVVTFTRNTATGKLTYLSVTKDPLNFTLNGAREITFLSNETLLVTSSLGKGVVSLNRATIDGGLYNLWGRWADGVGGVDGLNGASGSAITTNSSIDIGYYVAGYSDNGVAIFGATSGSGFGYLGVVKDGVGGVDGLAGVRDVAVSPDGKNVYMAGQTDNAVAIFSRNASTNMLTYVGVIKDTVSTPGLKGAWDVEVSPDGGTVFVSGTTSNSLVRFTRDPATGKLTYVDSIVDGVSTDGLLGARGVVVAPDGHGVFVVGFGDKALVSITRTGTDNVTVSAGKGSVKNFTGENNLSVIEGNVWYDTASPSGNSIKENSEATIGSVRVFLDMNYDGVWNWETGEPSQFTTLDGAYHFTVPSGRYKVSADLATYSLTESAGSWSDVLTQTSSVASPDGYHAGNMVISADGKYAFTATDKNKVYAYTRNLTTGALTLVSSATDAAGTLGRDDSGRDIDVVQDVNGTFIYVTGLEEGAISVYKLNTTTNAMTLQQKVKNGVLGLTTLTTAYGIEVSPDGAQVYVTDYDGDNGVVYAFTRTSATGLLSAPQKITLAIPAPNASDPRYPLTLTVSPDKTKIYVSGDSNTTGGRIWILTRNLGTGIVTYTGTSTYAGQTGTMAVSSDNLFLYQANPNQTITFDLSVGVTSGVYAENLYSAMRSSVPLRPEMPSDFAELSPDGQHFIVSGGGAGVDIYRVDPITRNLMHSGFFAVEGANSATFSPDGKNIYVNTWLSGTKVLSRTKDFSHRVTAYPGQVLEGIDFGITGSLPGGTTSGSGWFNLPRVTYLLLSVPTNPSENTSSINPLLLEALKSASWKLSDIWGKKVTGSEDKESKSSFFDVFKNIFGTDKSESGKGGAWGLKFVDLGDAIGKFDNEG